MMSGYRVSEAVIVPARTAALLAKLLDLDRRRVEWRGSDAELDAVLLAWREVVLTFTESQLNGRVRTAGFTVETADASTPKLAASCEYDEHPLTPANVADLLDMTEQAVTKAARERRLEGRQVAGRWTFTRAAVAIYQANRRP